MTGESEQNSEVQVGAGGSSNQTLRVSGARAFVSLNRFLQTPVGGAFLTLVVGTIMSGLFGAYIKNGQQKEQERSARLQTIEAKRQELISTSARIFTARRIYAGTAISAIEHLAPIDVVTSRWNDYQRAYIDYNQYTFAFRAASINFFGAGDANLFLPALDNSVSTAFSRIDNCLSSSYYLYLSGLTAAAKYALTSCEDARVSSPSEWPVRAELDRLNVCLLSVESEVVYFSYLKNNFDQSPNSPRELNSRSWLVSSGRSIIDAVLSFGRSVIDAVLAFFQSPHAIHPIVGRISEHVIRKDRAENEYRAVVFFNGTLKKDAGCAHTDWGCWLQQSRERVPGIIDRACGELGESNYTAERHIGYSGSRLQVKD